MPEIELIQLRTNSGTLTTLRAMSYIAIAQQVPISSISASVDRIHAVQAAKNTRLIPSQDTLLQNRMAKCLRTSVDMPDSNTNRKRYITPKISVTLHS
ncbi:hypothetical protein [Herminiimonas arsenitoxidans]|uniref:hypothetical protein n=1 Tax=Herminiimonas arsenitoxidans TaxID=1809410 RepID=UPI0009708787|nr:hypothetical protein [Herminiimonas arsenitoxidans]